MKINRTEPDVETIVARIRRGDLDLQPAFQRGEIWDGKRKQRLIDTILRRWYVPAVHVVEKDYFQEVLDGQQRLAAVRDFLDNSFRVDGKAEPPNHLISSLDGLLFDELPAHIKRAFLGYVIPVNVLTDYEPQEPNELFFRLNQAYNLTPPEKRNALHGSARTQVRKLVSELAGIGLLQKDSIGFTNSRLAYDDIVSRACVSLESNNLRQHINNDVVESYYRNPGGFSDSTEYRLRDSGAQLLEQIDSAPGRVRFNKGTLQTWLVYLAWTREVSWGLPDTFLAEFELARKLVRTSSPEEMDPAVFAAVSLYEDRASYRVTDVSSVLIRDLALQVFASARFQFPEVKGSDSLVQELRISRGSPQQTVAQFLEASSWGANFLHEVSK